MENFADWLYRTRMRKGKFTSQLVLAGLSGYSDIYPIWKQAVINHLRGANRLLWKHWG